MNKYILLSTLVLCITACDTHFSGRLHLKEPLKFVNLTPQQAKNRTECQAPDKQNSKKCLSLQKQIDKSTTVIEQGIYTAKVSVGKEELTLKILEPGSSKTLQELPIKISDGIRLPRYSGEISLTPEQTGRSFGVQGAFDTQEFNSKITYSTESCSYQAPYKWCGYITIKDPQTGESRQVYRCRTKYQTHHGSQQVAYYYHHTDKEITLNLVKANGSVVAEYNGADHNSSKVYTHKGYCNAHYRGYY